MSANGLAFHQASTAIDTIRIPGLGSFSFDPGEQVDNFEEPGIVQLHMAAVTRANPMATLTTRALATLLNGTTGLFKDSATSPNSDEFPMRVLDGTNGLVAIDAQAFPSKPGNNTGSVHRQIAMPAGLAYLSGLSWSQDSPVQASIGIMGRSTDGTTVPWAETAVAAPTITAVKDAWTLESVTFAGTNQANIQSCNLAINCNARQVRANGLPYPNLITAAGQGGAGAINWSFELRDLAAAAALHRTTGLLVVVLKNYAHGGGLGANTLTFTCYGSFGIRRGRSSGPDTMDSISFQCLDDGTHKPLAWDYA